MKTFEIAKRLFAIAGCAAALGLAAAPTSASADVHWIVNAKFDDGGTLTGAFDINQYGYISDYDLKTAGGTGGFTPTEYKFPVLQHWSGTVDGDGNYIAPFYIEVTPDYIAMLNLVFQAPLNVASAGNKVIGGGPSFECQNSYSCYVPQGDIRYIDKGSANAAGAAIPEPAAWALMLTGFAGMGAMLRRSRRQAVAVRA